MNKDMDFSCRPQGRFTDSIMKQIMKHPDHIRDLFDNDYKLSLFYYNQFSHIVIFYPFYCIEPVLELGQNKFGEVKNIMFGIRCIHSKEGMSEEDMYMKAIQRVMIGVVSDRKKLICNEHEKTGGKLFSGGYKI